MIPSGNAAPARNVGRFVAAGAVLVAVGALVVRHRRRLVEPSGPGERAGTTEPPAPLRPAALVWLGPVSAEQVEGTSLEGVPVKHLQCIGAVSPGDGERSCSQLADAWKDAEGRRLPGLRRALKLPDGPVFLAAFSAGGHIAWRLLEHPADRAEVCGVLLADASYTTERTPAGGAKPRPSLVAFAQEVAADPRRIFVASGSAAPNKNHPTAAESLAAIAVAAGLDPVAPLGLEAKRWSGGRGVQFFDFAGSYSHSEHATKVAPALWRSVVQPHFLGAST